MNPIIHSTPRIAETDNEPFDQSVIRNQIAIPLSMDFTNQSVAVKPAPHRLRRLTGLTAQP